MTNAVMNPVDDIAAIKKKCPVFLHALGVAVREVLHSLTIRFFSGIPTSMFALDAGRAAKPGMVSPFGGVNVFVSGTGSSAGQYCTQLIFH